MISVANVMAMYCTTYLKKIKNKNKNTLMGNGLETI